MPKKKALTPKPKVSKSKDKDTVHMFMLHGFEDAEIVYSALRVTEQMLVKNVPENRKLSVKIFTMMEVLEKMYPQLVQQVPIPSAGGGGGRGARRM